MSSYFVYPYDYCTGTYRNHADDGWKLIKPTDHRKSFYGKAQERMVNGVWYLMSYDTIVCAVSPSGEFRRYWMGYSATTMRHINSFLESHGFKGMGKGEWCNLPGSKLLFDYDKGGFTA